MRVIPHVAFALFLPRLDFRMRLIPGQTDISDLTGFPKFALVFLSNFLCVWVKRLSCLL